MQITQTQDLVKSLALDFIHNKVFNFSILQLLAVSQKIHANTTHQHIQNNIKIIDKAFVLLKQHIQSKKDKHKSLKQTNYENSQQRNFYNMVTVFVFNVSAINQHYFNEIQKQMTESTASQSVADLNKTFYKDKMALNFLKEHLKLYFSIFTSKSNFLQTLISDIVNSQNQKITQSQLGLLQTLDYLCVKYSIQNDTVNKIVKILQKNENFNQENSSVLIRSDLIKEVNKLLFSQAKQNQLYQILQSNSHINFRNLLNIVNANYLNTNPPRKIFNTAQLSGKQAIEGIIIRLIKRIGKNELFSQKTQQYTPFRLLLFHFLTKHYSVYMEFNNIVKDLMYNVNLNNEQTINKLKQIQKIFCIVISIENPHFHQLIQFIYKILVDKYSQQNAWQLIKKLILNRFLLNPSFFVLYNQPDEQDIQKYVQAANVVRALFYSNKSQQLSQKYKTTQIIKTSNEILNSLNYCLRKQKDNKLILQNSNFLYVNDKILKGQMQQFYEQLSQSYNSGKQAPKQSVQIQNMVSDYSLSFSLVKNEASRNQLNHPIIQNVSQVHFAANTNRSNTNLKDNQSIRFMYEQLKGQKSSKQIPPKSPQKKLKVNTAIQNKQQKHESQNKIDFGHVSQLARKQHEISNQTRLNSMRQLTDRQMIEQLVQIRKQYGQLKRCLKRQIQERKNRKNKKMAYLKSFTARFNQFKQQVQSQNNTLYVHMTTIA